MTDFAAKSKNYTARISGDFPLRDGRNFVHAFRFRPTRTPQTDAQQVCFSNANKCFRPDLQVTNKLRER